jgi:parvulin-like peptidyl-prolyl isomerase
MKLLFGVFFCVTALLSASGQQLPQPPATCDEIAFFHYLLTSIADPAIDPNMAKQNETNMILQYGLDDQEAAAFHAAGLQFASAMNDFRNKRRVILAGKAIPSPTDEPSLAAASAALDQEITSITNRLLNSLRPGKAVLMRFQGQLVGAATAAARARVVSETSETTTKGVE